MHGRFTTLILLDEHIILVKLTIKGVYFMSKYCISAPIVYDWITIMEEMKKCIYIPMKRNVKLMEDCICINFQVNCQAESPTTIWQAVGDKMHAATFSISHDGTCFCDWLILANQEEIATVSPTNTVSATIGDLENLSIVCVSGCSDDNVCEGTLHIVVHYLLSTDKEKEKKPKKVTCFLSDKHGNPVDGNQLLCREIGRHEERFSKCFLTPNGGTVCLQKVSILITGYITVKVTDLYDDSCVVCTYPIRLVKNLFLCAPDGTDIVCKIDRFFCEPYLVNSETYKDCTKVCLDIDFCLNVQSIYQSVLNIEGNLCEPRGNLINNLNCNVLKVGPII